MFIYNRTPPGTPTIAGQESQQGQGLQQHAGTPATEGHQQNWETKGTEETLKTAKMPTSV